MDYTTLAMLERVSCWDKCTISKADVDSLDRPHAIDFEDESIFMIL